MQITLKDLFTSSDDAPVAEAITMLLFAIYTETFDKINNKLNSLKPPEGDMKIEWHKLIRGYADQLQQVEDEEDVAELLDEMIESFKQVSSVEAGVIIDGCNLIPATANA
jgi:hypothetical protein